MDAGQRGGGGVVIDPAHPFARATWDLLMVMHDRQLPAPLSLNWSQYSSQLSVQVPPGDFLRWLDALSQPTRSTSSRDGRTHYRASGVLRGAPDSTVRLTAVSAVRPVAA